MKSMGAVFVMILLFGLTSASLAQESRPTPTAPPPSSPQTKAKQPATKAKQTDILQALGKLKLADFKKANPRSTESTIKPEPNTRLATVGAVTRIQEPSGAVIYYFNRAGILVSAQAKATRPLTREQLEKDIKGLKFEVYPPNDIMAAFIRRSPQVVQGFYLGPNDEFVEYTTFDYLPKR
jgi:hypothetical protein